MTKKHTIHSDQTKRTICTVIRHIYHYTTDPTVKDLCEKAFLLGKQLNESLIRRKKGYAKYWEVDVMPESVIKIAKERRDYRPKQFTPATYEYIARRRHQLHDTPIYDVLNAIIGANRDTQLDIYAHEALWMAERMIRKLNEPQG